MAPYASEKLVLLFKKIGGILLLFIGLFMTAIGFTNGTTWLAVLGVLALVAGAGLLALKIVRRNQGVG